MGRDQGRLILYLLDNTLTPLFPRFLLVPLSFSMILPPEPTLLPRLQPVTIQPRNCADLIHFTVDCD